jgi:hypothetical protein
METLPNELLDMIARDITTESLKALHQVSRRVSAGTSDPYYTTFYATRTHAFSSTGLKVLAEILSIPGLLARINRIHIMPVKLDWYHWACGGQNTSNLPDESFESEDGSVRSVDTLRSIVSMVALHGSKIMITLCDIPHHLIDGPTGYFHNDRYKGIESLHRLMDQVYGVHTAFSRHDGRCARLEFNREHLLDDFHVALSSVSDELRNGLCLDLGFWSPENMRISDGPRFIEIHNQVYQFITVLKLPVLWSGMDWIHEPLCGARNLQHLAFKLASWNTSVGYPTVNRTGRYSLNALLLQSLTYCAAVGAWPKLRQLEICNSRCPALIQTLLTTCSSAPE